MQKIHNVILQDKVSSLQAVIDQVGGTERTIQRYLKELKSLTSYTHRGRYVTLPDIPRFDDNGIWFFQQIGFSKLGSSLDTIVGLIDDSDSGVSREELEAILKIGISKQIQILIQREKIHRVKLGSRYLYLPQRLMLDKKKRLQIVGKHQAEERLDKDVHITDLVALLKAVLIEKKIGIDFKSIKRFTQKYSLSIPLKKIEQLLLKYDLRKKKSPNTGKTTADEIQKR